MFKDDEDILHQEDNVLYPDFGGNLDIDPERVVEFAKQNVQFSKILIIGEDQDGEPYIAGSTTDKTWLIYVTEQFKHKLLSGDYD